MKQQWSMVNIVLKWCSLFYQAKECFKFRKFSSQIYPILYFFRKSSYTEFS